MKSLNEVEKMVGLNRRAIQEYESAGLARKPSTKTNKGYLLYDTPEIERLWQLKFYKECGYNIPEIKKLQEKGKLEEKEEWERLIRELKEKRNQLDNLILIAEEILERSLDFNTLRNSMFPAEEPQWDHVFEWMGLVFKLFKTADTDRMFQKITFTDEESDRMLSLVETMLDFKSKGAGIEDGNVQNAVSAIHKILSRELSGSVAVFRTFIGILTADTELKDLFGEDYGKEETDFTLNAFQFYCEQHRENLCDQNLNQAYAHLETLARSNCSYRSEEVQSEIGRIHEFLSDIKLFTKKGSKEVMKLMSELYDSQSFKEIMDRGAQRGFGWFLSKAIDVYLHNLERKKEETCMTSEEIKIFIETQEKVGDVWTQEQVMDVYGEESLQEALQDRQRSISVFSDIIEDVLNRSEK
ncbi:MAG: MerR family transcriptional regulator [Clostridiales bacterium]|nr:MerR family transcriptional regulator [Clostridiales bacterium]